MDKKIIDLGDALMALTTAEAVQLQDYLESKGLKPAQPTVVATAAAPKEEEVKESANVNVVLTQKGATNMKLIKAYTDISKKSPMEAKKVTDTIPAVLFENTPRAIAKEYVDSFQSELGPEYIFELQDC